MRTGTTVCKALVKSAVQGCGFRVEGLGFRV